MDEALYRSALCIELSRGDVQFACEVVVDVTYRDVVIGQKRIDLLVGGRLVVELKAVERLAPVHGAQLRTYLKITKCKLGLLFNFNEFLLKDGIKRVINPGA